MAQFLFFTSVFMVLIVGAFVFLFQSQKQPMDPIGYVLEHSGFTSLQLRNRQQIEQLNIKNERGLITVQGKIDNLAMEQEKFLNMVQDQQQILKNTEKEAQAILLKAQQDGSKNDNDILQLKSLSSEIENEQHLLVAQGQQLINLNDQLNLNRKMLEEQADFKNINSGPGNGINDALQQMADRTNLTPNSGQNLRPSSNDSQPQSEDAQDQRDKVQDQLWLQKQQQEDQKERMQDQENR